MAYIINNGVLEKYLPEPGETELILPDNIQTIRQGAFVGCDNLYSVHIPEGVIRILNGAFKECRNLLYVKLPESLRRMEADVFRSCESLEEMTIPENVDTIPMGGFRGCTNLTSVILPKQMKNIYSRAFMFCWKLKTVKMPEKLEYLGHDVFVECRNLTAVTIPNGIEVIKNGTFYGCDLDFVTIPKSVKKIESRGAFPEKTVLHFQIKDQEFSVNYMISIWRHLCDVFCQPELPENINKIIEYLIDDIDELKRFLECGLITTGEQIDTYIRYANKKEKYEAQIVLMEYKHEHIGYPSKNWEL